MGQVSERQAYVCGTCGDRSLNIVGTPSGFRVYCGNWHEMVAVPGEEFHVSDLIPEMTALLETFVGEYEDSNHVFWETVDEAKTLLRKARGTSEERPPNRS